MIEDVNKVEAEGPGEPRDAIRDEHIATLQANEALAMERLKAQLSPAPVDEPQEQPAPVAEGIPVPGPSSPEGIVESLNTIDELQEPEPAKPIDPPVAGPAVVVQALGELIKARLDAIDERLDVLEQHSHTHPHSTSWAPVPTHPKPAASDPDPAE